MTSTASTPTIALITGGNRGLGRATALALADAGTDVIITYRGNETEAEEVITAVQARGRQGVALRLDVTDLDAFAGLSAAVTTALTERWSRTTFDFLINNAGYSAEGSVTDTSVADFDAMIAVHVRGPFFLTQALLPLLADGGRIVNLSTGLARFVGGPYAAYGAAKGAVEVWTRYLAAELGPRGISANVIAPGPIGTDFAGGMMRDNQQLRAALEAQTAQGRVGEPADIGGAVAALVAPGSGWISGQRIEVGGGFRL